MGQINTMDARIIPFATHVTKSVGDEVKTEIHYQTTVPTGTHRFYFWSVFGEYLPETEQFAFMSGAISFGYLDVGTIDQWVAIYVTLGELGEVYAGDWDCLLLITETDNFLTGYVYDMAVILNTLTITGVLTAQLLEVSYS